MAHRLSPQAQADIDDIAYYIFVESGSLETADRLIESIYGRFVLLGTYPALADSEMTLFPNLRVFPVGDYLVLYRVEGKDVLIVRVVRGSRDLEALLHE